MLSSSSDENRNVIPRWRPLVATADWALQSARSLDGGTLLPALYEDDLSRWRAEGTVEAAFDIFSAGLMSADTAVMWEGGLKLVSQPSLVDERVLETVKRTLSPTRELSQIRQRISSLEQKQAYLRLNIRLLKKRIRTYPRDTISLLELARNYAILGEYEKAQKWLRACYTQAPENRLVLRAAVQLFEVTGELEKVLPWLWRSTALKYDPLVQSAEIAAADIAGRGSKVASKVRDKLKGVRRVSKEESELALGLATLESASGRPERTVFKLVSAGLNDPTENAVAQAVWLGEQSNRTLTNRFPALQIAEDAFEARAYILFDNKQYAMALNSAYYWYNDQPFQAHPLTFICTCAAIYYDSPTEALHYADLIMQKHQNDWNALNSALLVYSATGLKDRAFEAHSLMAHEAKSDVARAFVSAGRGLLSFAFENGARADSYYLDSMKISKKAQRQDLVFTAAAFYTLGLAKSGAADAAEIGNLIAVLEKSLARIPPASRHDADTVFDRVKTVIATKCGEALSNARETSEHKAINVASLPELLGSS